MRKTYQVPRGRFSQFIRGYMAEQFISGLKKKRDAKKTISKSTKFGKTAKNSQVFKNDLLDTDYTAGPTTSKRKGAIKA